MSVRAYCKGGCGRYRTCPDESWYYICPEHNRRVPKALKRVRTRIRRKIDRYGWTPALGRRWRRCLDAIFRAAATRPPKEIEEWL